MYTHSARRGKGGGRSSINPIHLAYGGVAVVVIIALFAGVKFLTSEDGSAPVASEGTDSARVTTWLGSLELEVGNVAGSADEHYQAGRQAYLKDTITGYDSARQSFKKALVVAPQHGLAMAGLIEAEVNTPIRRLDFQKSQLLYDLATHAVRLAPKSPHTHRAKGTLRLALGKVDQARTDASLARKVAGVGGDPEALVLLGETYLGESPDISIDYFQDVRMKAPEVRRVLRVLADAYRRTDRSAKALDVLRERLDEEPDHVGSLIAAADILAQNGRFKQARQRYREALKGGRGAEPGLIGLAILLYQGFGEWDEAATLLGVARDAAKQGRLGDAQQRRLYTHLGVLLRQNDDIEAALAAVEKALELDNQDLPALFLKADLLLRSGQVVQAKKMIDLVLERRPEFPAALRKAARIAEQLPDLALAVQLYNRAASIDKYSVDSLVTLAGMYARLQQVDRVYGIIHKSLNLAPDLGGEVRELTDFYEPSEHTAAAAEALAVLAKEQREEPLAHTALGIALFTTGNFKESMKALRRALELDEENLGAHLYLAANYVRLGKLAKAEKAVRVALRIDRLCLAAHYVAGRVAEAHKLWKAAARHYSEALEVDIAYLPANLRLGLVQLRLGKKESAEGLLRQVAGAQPDNLVARRELFGLH